MSTDEYYISIMKEIAVCKGAIRDIEKKLAALDHSTDETKTAELKAALGDWKGRLMGYEQALRELQDNSSR